MITLQRYLYAAKAGSAAAQPDDGPLHLLSSGLMEGIADHVLRDDEFAELRSSLGALRQRLDAPLTAEAAEEIRGEAHRILARYAVQSQSRSTSLAIEMQHILGILNSALMGMASGNARSTTRLQKIQESLQRTSAIQDMTGLKACLADTMQFIREEARREQETSSKELSSLEAELDNARELASRSRVSLPGRPEGVRHIAHEIKGVPANSSLYLVAYRFDRLQALVQRYGAEAAEELLLRVVDERVRPLAPAGASFRWTASSLVAVFQRASNRAEVVAEAAALNRNPLQYRLPLGNRTATLTIHPSHLVAEGTAGLPEPLIAEVDGFTGATE